MKEIKIDLNSVKNWGGKLTKNLAWLFFMFFLVLVLFEIFEINTSLQIYLSFNQSPPLPPSKDKGVRVDFDKYNQAINRIQQAGNFTPSAGLPQDPFRSQ